CLFSNPGFWTTGRHQKGPHRRCFKTSSILRVAAEPTGGVSSRYLTGFLAIAEDRRTPTGTCDFGQRRYRLLARLDQRKMCRRVEKIGAMNKGVHTVS